jgi:uncharacterized protein (DUF1501 family)
MHTHKPARRDFLKLSTRLATLGLTGMGLGPSRSWFVSDAYAASPVSDYKALVCVYLFGGNDCNNTVVPIDSARYPQYAALRTSQLALTAAQLTPLSADYALHSSLAALQPLFAANRMAVVLNTGQLERPLTKAQYQQGLLRPSNLFSHSDQTIQAQTATSNSTIGGWGGRLLDAFGAADTLAAVSVSSPATWLQSGGGAPNVIPPGASLDLSGLNIQPTAAAQARTQAVNAMLALDGGHPLRTAANDAFADGLQLAAALRGANPGAALQTVFPGTGLGNQMREVVRLIRLRSQIGPGRQVFFCSMGGYDTHTGQAGSHGNLLAELGNALRAFHDATVEIGLSNQITAFTQSEFGRTLEPNGTGTDHAWGAHQFIVGGAVRGGIYGAYPTLALGGPDDVTDRGVWLPTIGTSQFGATLGRWFGASPGELTVAFPNLSTFATSDVGFML